MNCLFLILLSVIALHCSTVCHAQLWQMNSVPFLYRNSQNAPPAINPAVPTPKPGSRSQPTLRGEFKWVARIDALFRGYDGTTDYYQCAATLISNLWVLTSAHCVKQRGLTAASVTITLGRYNSSQQNESGSISHTVSSSSIFIHTYYGSANPTYDFALIRLVQPISSRMSVTIGPIALPDVSYCSDSYSGNTYPIDGCRTVATTAGWVPGKDNMQKTIVSTYYYQSCNAWKAARVFTDATLCAGGMNYGDICVGDPGSSLMCRDEEDQWYLLAVASYGDPDCDVTATRRLPAVYSRVCAALPWITNTMTSNPIPMPATRQTTPRTTTTTTTTPEPYTEPILLSSNNGDEDDFTSEDEQQQPPASQGQQWWMN